MPSWCSEKQPLHCFVHSRVGLLTYSFLFPLFETEANCWVLTFLKLFNPESQPDRSLIPNDPRLKHDASAWAKLSRLLFGPAAILIQSVFSQLKNKITTIAAKS